MNDGKFDKRVLFKGDPLLKKYIYITYTESHFNVIKSIKSYFDRSYYCDICKVAYANIGKHTCKNMCYMCKDHRCLTNKNILPVMIKKLVTIKIEYLKIVVIKLLNVDF